MLLRTARCSEPPSGPRLINWDSPHCRQLLVGHIGMNLIAPQPDANVTYQRRQNGFHQPSYNYGIGTFNHPNATMNVGKDPYTGLWLGEGYMAYVGISHPGQWFGQFNIDSATPTFASGYNGSFIRFPSNLVEYAGRHWWSCSAPEGLGRTASSLWCVKDGAVLTPNVQTDAAGYDWSEYVGYQFASNGSGGGNGPTTSLMLLLWRRVVPLEEQREIVDSGGRAMLTEPVPKTWFFLSPPPPPAVAPLFYRRR